MSQILLNQIQQPQNLQLVITQRTVQLFEHGLEICWAEFPEGSKGGLLLLESRGCERLQFSPLGAWEELETTLCHFLWRF